MTNRPKAVQHLPVVEHTLACHPSAPCVLPLQVRVRLWADDAPDRPGLLLRYELLGDMRCLRLPAPKPPGPVDGLWQHTCFEAFVGMVGDPAYREFNFSPSGQWAAYRFSAERQRDAAAEATQPPVLPRIEVHKRPETLHLLAWLPWQALPAPVPGQGCDIGLSAVIETSDGQLSHWALQHPTARPDFHHRGGWHRLPELPTLLASAATP